jgi:hypothetical protein
MERGEPRFRESNQNLDSLRLPVCLENRMEVSSLECERLLRARADFFVMAISRLCTSRDGGISRRR